MDSEYLSHALFPQTTFCLTNLPCYTPLSSKDNPYNCNILPAVQQPGVCNILIQNDIIWVVAIAI